MISLSLPLTYNYILYPTGPTPRPPTQIRPSGMGGAGNRLFIDRSIVSRASSLAANHKCRTSVELNRQVNLTLTLTITITITITITDFVPFRPSTNYHIIKTCQHPGSNSNSNPISNLIPGSEAG
jgi:hypothetical protein